MCVVVVCCIVPLVFDDLSCFGEIAKDILIQTLRLADGH